MIQANHSPVQTLPVIDSEDAAIDQKKKGDAYLDLGNLAEAGACYRSAIALAPDCSKAYNNLGLILAEEGHHGAAVKNLTHAIALNQTFFNSYYILGTIAHRLNKLDEAVEYFRLAVSINPAFSEGLDYLGLLLKEQGNLKQSIDCYRRALAINPLQQTTHSSLLWTLQYDGTLPQADRYAEHRSFAELFEAPLIHSRKPHDNDRSIYRRLRIGYVSPDFRRHSVAIFMLPVLTNHDKKQFEIFCYYNYASGDEYTERFAEISHQFVSCAGMSDDELCERIRADGIDILVDLSGHTAHHRLLTFARKPAPIQVSYLGYVDTTGLAAIDYRLTNEAADPPGNDRYYSETLYRFRNNLWWTFRPAPNLPDLPPLPALTNGYVTFLSSNQIAKISPPTMDMWAKILCHVPDSKLVFVGIPEGLARALILGRFARNGVDGARLAFHNFMPLDRYRNLLLRSDICLDTFPFNGGTTTCETLALGLPVITMKGQSFASRMGYALLQEIGLTELVASSGTEYVNIAVKLANDLAHLSTLRSGMRDRIAVSSLVDEVRFTRSLETAYREMWMKYASGEK